jgi:hypothetical protein
VANERKKEKSFEELCESLSFGIGWIPSQRSEGEREREWKKRNFAWNCFFFAAPQLLAPRIPSSLQPCPHIHIQPRRYPVPAATIDRPIVVVVVFAIFKVKRSEKVSPKFRREFLTNIGQQMNEKNEMLK